MQIRLDRLYTVEFFLSLHLQSKRGKSTWLARDSPFYATSVWRSIRLQQWRDPQSVQGTLHYSDNYKRGAIVG